MTKLTNLYWKVYLIISSIHALVDITQGFSVLNPMNVKLPAISPFTYLSDTLLSLSQVESWLEDLLWEKKSSMDIYRCKGILHIHDSDQVHTLQVFTTYSYNNQEGLHYELGLSSIFLSDFPL